MKFKSDDISINTLLGEGSFFSGDIKINGFVRVDGDINGNIETDGRVILSEKSRVNGNIKANSLIAGGIVRGDIFAEKSVKLLSTALIIGDIYTHNIQIEDKVIFHGHCISLRDSGQFKQSYEAYNEQKLFENQSKNY